MLYCTASKICILTQLVTYTHAYRNRQWSTTIIQLNSKLEALEDN